ncbi:hypothetical protein AVEN_241166-1 [Araneus ventricosus]|uniref:Histone-lysine N-methyltransferase SETMAR n=1 Tax=Araneus ventricosus TaxID=182803 RepID=A0A4Y2G2C3_ARAVE|nr:hypothetical protein AVEN_241166-1 [Araneus ventricosus]
MGVVLHDNARPHIALLVKQFLATHEVLQMNPPPSCQDFASVNFFLFPKLKKFIKRTKFEHVKDIVKIMTSEFKSIPKEDFGLFVSGIYTDVHRNELGQVEVTSKHIK